MLPERQRNRAGQVACAANMAGRQFQLFSGVERKVAPVNGVVPGFEENLGQRAILASLPGHLLGNVLAIGNPFGNRSVFTVVR
ncbi:hypothetical protein IWQ54_004838 [Labrenzia sp. EL_195]|nr:hypothetical protein [Labrenzia sp. EL_195]